MVADAWPNSFDVKNLLASLCVCEIELAMVLFEAVKLEDMERTPELNERFELSTARDIDLPADLKDDATLSKKPMTIFCLVSVCGIGLYIHGEIFFLKHEQN